MSVHIVNEDNVPIETFGPGRTKFLYQSADGGPDIMIRYFGPTVLDAHAHPFNEMFYILEGELQIADTIYGPGSCIFVSKDTPYGPVHAPRGEAKVLRYADGRGEKRSFKPEQ